jgi:predicted hydrolase (HD superfamily)
MDDTEFASNQAIVRVCADVLQRSVKDKDFAKNERDRLRILENVNSDDLFALSQKDRVSTNRN